MSDLEMRPIQYVAHATVEGGRNGRGRTSDGLLELELRMPKEFGGSGDAPNPEQLFAIGYAACFGSSIETVAKRLKADVEGLELAASVGVTPNGGAYKLVIVLDVTLPNVTDAAHGAEVIDAAHAICLYSNATRGNVDFTVTVNGHDAVKDTAP